MHYLVQSEKQHTVYINRKGDQSRPFKVKVGEREYTVDIRKTHPDGRLKTLMIDNRVYPVEVERRGDGFPSLVWLKGVPFKVEIEKVESTRYRPPAAAREVSGEVRASLPGVVVAFLVKAGQTVEKGQVLGVLEAMKMENEILAPRSGTVSEIAVKPGQIVAKNDLLLTVG